ncbi:MAG TPA: multifunctional oxoglutarate decarboxylase/oxoglutarate dehydrogenase thiamine pyrophosphate-binding subunit/dihydrolipoyllysine-residue succinyltransferase subunit [Acidimicrobiia bacterium]|nr:multifunctional oxoglutarate decarboxylase/oxoglutarate dehydrogenase thiamine pyrophosphate-binding subunit/dihydrolipoyllysine-residue succinyltransferase subunit [Acidimicrobiia bacterium]
MPETPDIAAAGRNDWLIEEMYERYLDSPRSVSEPWRRYFENGGAVEGGGGAPAETPTAPARRENEKGEAPAPETETPEGEGQGRSEGQGGSEGAAETDAASVPENAAALKGILGVIADRMDESLSVPTATSVRTMPAKLLEVNRKILNNQLKRVPGGGKVSFTHLIGWAVVRAMREFPEMNVSFREIDGTPHIIRHAAVNLGLAIDMERPDGSRVLLVPAVKAADQMDFRGFWEAYEVLVAKTRNNKLSPDDFAGTTATLTNPGTIGTVQSVPRLMPDQGVIVGVGAIAYPPEYQGADAAYLARQGVGRIISITSTYDHRVIQGAQSGEFLARIHQLLLGEDEFYDEIFRSLSIPYTPARWAKDENPPIGSDDWIAKQANVFRIINAYRVRGHLLADLDPLRMEPPRMFEELNPLSYGLTIWDLDREFATGGILGRETMTLGSILSLLRDAYCRTVGVEYMHIQEPGQKRWIQDRVEVTPSPALPEERMQILRKLNEAESFETFLHTKYVGQKRFGLEGCESLIPMLDSVLTAATGDGMSEAVIGMAHRGRLNVLTNIIGKPLPRIFREFDGDLLPGVEGGADDVKYHLGATGTYESAAGDIGVEVVANPSHLEAVDPVLEGVARAKQEKVGPDGHRRVLPILMHGDAAYAGQGVVVETHNLSQLRGYRTGGTIHVVVNNQVGFTTSTLDARSSFYATDVAKTVQAPIFHVNGDDPEAVTRVARLAFEFRQTFHKDVVIDMVCYRRRGHNEGDEPSYTQPLMYKRIDEHPSVRKLYLDRLMANDLLSEDEADGILFEYRQMLDAAFKTSKEPTTVPAAAAAGADDSDPPTGVDRERLEQVLHHIADVPEGFTVHPKLERIVAERSSALEDDIIDWGTAEALAFGSLALEGVPIRLAGEDSRRGTFSHRHAELTDYRTGEVWAPLETLTAGETRVRIVDSLLSEFAAVGFEYGYSIEWPEALVMWEAQYGDFANGAQVVFDQFIAAGEAKWGQSSGLTLLLPHGYEGQGPEHSSARIERFLELAAGDNLRVAIPATSGQYFHLLRRQALRRPQKPLIVFTPKSLLRSRASFVRAADLESGRFEALVPDDVEGASRLVLCAGKVYHDLDARRREAELDDVAIVRLAQLHPLPAEELERLAEQYTDATLVWCQEEPENMGAYRFLWPQLREIFGQEPVYAGRKPAGSPATGSARVHREQQAYLVDQALGLASE